jgi:hypothetical protein
MILAERLLLKSPHVPCSPSFAGGFLVDNPLATSSGNVLAAGDASISLPKQHFILTIAVRL